MQATGFEKQNKDKQITFWFPILLPVLMGFVVATAEFATGLAQTGVITTIGKELADLGPEDWMPLLKSDLLNLWAGTTKGVASTMFSVDIWALTMLYTSHSTTTRSYAYGYPILGIFAHFILLLLATSLVTFATKVEDITILLLFIATLVSLYYLLHHRPVPRKLGQYAKSTPCPLSPIRFDRVVVV